MLLVDYRAGSKELIVPLKRMGLEVVEWDLPSGDISFEGRGEGGKTVVVGVEFKKLSELVGSLRTGRLQGLQAPNMRLSFDYSYLLIEGNIRFDKSDRLLRRTGRHSSTYLAGHMSTMELMKRMLVMHLCGGLTPIWSQNRRLTLKWIEALYRTWTDQNLDEHKSHLAIYTAPTLVPVSDFRQAVMMWPGIGFKASLAAEQMFGGSITRAAMAPLQTWAAITTTDKEGKTRRLGATTATKIKRFLK